LVSDSKEFQIKQTALLLIPYIQDESISHGKAAEILGINKLDLIDYYSELGIPYFNLSIEEFESDLVTLRSLSGSSE
jgi:predicted HTH domain antitoxin